MAVLHVLVLRSTGRAGPLKWASALWTPPLVVLAQRVRPGPCGDFSDFVPWAAAADAALPFDELVADAGYDGEANSRFCREVGRCTLDVRRQPDPG
jgi:hypothetical protein